MDNATPTPAASPSPERKRGPAQAALVALLLGVSLLLAYRTYSPAWSARPSEPIPPARQIDVNIAERSELLQVPGIGNNMADNILAHRREFGNFRQIDDLQSVKGVGAKTLDKLRPWLRVEAAETAEPVEVLARKPNSTAMKASTASLPATRSAKLKPGDPPINVNKATEEDFLRLPGVGPTLAANLVAYRREGYKTIAELRRARGIGAKTLENIRPFITIVEANEMK